MRDIVYVTSSMTLPTNVFTNGSKQGTKENRIWSPALAVETTRNNGELLTSVKRQGEKNCAKENWRNSDSKIEQN
jgi:hypothetical protein